jgi:hypothetical protein
MVREGLTGGLAGKAIHMPALFHSPPATDMSFPPLSFYFLFSEGKKRKSRTRGRHPSCPSSSLRL